jgi:hypothetical protein
LKLPGPKIGELALQRPPAFLRLLEVVLRFIDQRLQPLKLQDRLRLPSCEPARTMVLLAKTFTSPPQPLAQPSLRRSVDHPQEAGRIDVA